MIVMRRKCFANPSFRWDGSYVKDGQVMRTGNAVQAALGISGRNTPTMVRGTRMDGSTFWYEKDNDADYRAQYEKGVGPIGKPNPNIVVGSTAAEAHEANKYESNIDAAHRMAGEQAAKAEAMIEEARQQEEANQKRKDDLTKGAMIGAGVAAVGAAGYGAYKAWKKKKAKKKAANAAAEDKFKK